MYTHSVYRFSLLFIMVCGLYRKFVHLVPINQGFLSHFLVWTLVQLPLYTTHTHTYNLLYSFDLVWNIKNSRIHPTSSHAQKKPYIPYQHCLYTDSLQHYCLLLTQYHYVQWCFTKESTILTRNNQCSHKVYTVTMTTCIGSCITGDMMICTCKYDNSQHYNSIISHQS